MILNPGDLVLIKLEMKKAIVRQRSGCYYDLHVRVGKCAWYSTDELELLKRGHYTELFTEEEKEEYKALWGSKAELI